MSVRGIRARFPSGVYRGHIGAGQYDLLPSPLRLHAALVSAAGDGTTALVEAGALCRTSDATRALEWLEDNPPEFVELPDVVENGLGVDKAFAYRDEGVVENVKKSPIRRKTPRTVVDSTALRGALGWGWTSMPDDVALELDSLCADVPCLGEGDSPVVLEVGEIAPTHRRNHAAGPFDPVALKLSVPRGGRLQELDDLYRRANPVKAPTQSADRWTGSELPTPPAISHHRAVELGYEPIIASPPVSSAPWSEMIFFPLTTEIPPEECLGWSVAMHRALVAALGDDATPVVTGRYQAGAVQPANRVAVQVLSREVMDQTNHPQLGAGIAILIPGAEALDGVLPAVTALRRLYRGGAGAVSLGQPVHLSTMDFWKPVEPGHVRTWAALPAVVPETRRQKSRDWSLADSALLSVGFVFRDQLSIAPAHRGADRYAAIVDAVAARSVKPLNTSLIAGVDVGKYVHKAPRGVVVQPYRLSITSGDLIPPQSLVAIGQSRHLGGGLLVPLDLPAAIASAWGVKE